jgi:hypothetical protein
MSQFADTDLSAPTDMSVGMVGTWFNTNRVAPEIAKVELAQANEFLLIRAYGAHDGAAVEWGEARAVPFAAPGQPGAVTGFEACFDADGVERHLAANLKLGVLVIQCYTHFRNVERGSYFTREFFHQRIESACDPAGGPADSAAADDGAALPYVQAGDRRKPGAKPPAGRVDLSPYLGIWRNTYRHTRAASHLELLRDDDGYLVHAFGVAAPRDWGAVRAVAYADDVGSQRPAGFFADYDFGFMDTRLAANFNQGLLIVAAYNRFRDDSGRANFFTREFFYHEQPFA